MFDILPGMSLGFSGSKEIAFGLAPISTYVPVIPDFPPSSSGGGGGVWGMNYTVYDNAYSSKTDDNEVIEILCCIIPVI